jgi:hypothetical protein
MKLLRDFRTSPLLGTLLVTLALSTSSAALADNDYKRKGGHSGRDVSHHNGHDNSWNRHDSDRRGYSRGYSHGYNRNHGNRFGHFRNDSRHSWRRGHNNHDNFSLSLNLGSGYYGSTYGSSLWYGTGLYGRTGYGAYNSSYNNWYSPYRNTTTVVVKQPSVVYVNDSAPVSRRVISTHTIQKPGVSLLRDIHGNCYERQVDGYGNETRIQLPDASCQF